MQSRPFFGGRYFFVILLSIFFLIQLPRVVTPPDRAQLVRQCDTAAVARNFYEEGVDILRPRIDIRAVGDGVYGMEFPFYNYVLYTGYKIFGFHHSLGKWVSLLAGIATLIAFQNLMARLHGEAFANTVSFMLASNVLFFGWVFKVMPDSTALMFQVFSLLTFYIALPEGVESGGKPKLAYLFGASLFLAVAVLMRPWEAIVTLPMFYFAWRRFGSRLLTMWEPYIFSAFAFAPCAWWYGYHVPRLRELEEFPWFFFGTPISENIGLLFSAGFRYGKLFFEVIPNDVVGWGAMIIVIAGIRSIYRDRYKKIEGVYLSLTVIAVYMLGIFVLTGNHVFKGHNYYLLACTPYLALLLGHLYFAAIREEKSGTGRIGLIFLVVVLLGLAGREGHTYSKDPYPGKIMEAAKFVDEVIPAMERIMVSDNGPIKLYYLHRKGVPVALDDGRLIKESVDRGVRWLVIVEDNSMTLEEVKERFKPENIWIRREPDIYVLKLPTSN